MSKRTCLKRRTVDYSLGTCLIVLLVLDVADRTNGQQDDHQRNEDGGLGNRLKMIHKFVGFAIGELLSSTSIVLFIALFLVVFKFIKILSHPEPPTVVYHKKTSSSSSVVGNQAADLVKNIPILHESYVPPALWGRNGHFQTVTYSIVFHRSLVRTSDARHSIRFDDGTTSTFDVFEPIKSHPEGDFTFVLCPGIANHSQNDYIRRFFHNAQEAGFRCAILNHLGAMKNIPITSPKIFTYGGVREYSAMVEKILGMYPDTKLIIVGFSMGGNIVTRYLGLRGTKISSRVVCGMSICQGYDANLAARKLHDWTGLRRLYNYIMTEKMKIVLRRNFDTAVKPHIRSGLVDEGKLMTATSLYVLDEQYTRRVHGFDSVDEYYRWCSSIHVANRIAVPMIYLNAADDPLIPPEMLKPIQTLAGERPDTLFICTKHGGHLGFMEGASLAPQPVSWLDRFAVDAANAAIKIYGKQMEYRNYHAMSKAKRVAAEGDEPVGGGGGRVSNLISDEQPSTSSSMTTTCSSLSLLSTPPPSLRQRRSKDGPTVPTGGNATEPPEQTATLLSNSYQSGQDLLVLLPIDV